MMSSLMATLGLDVSPFKRGLMEAQADSMAQSQKLKEVFGGIASEMMPFASIAGGAVALEEDIRKTVEYAEKIEHLSDRLGISTDAIQQWDYALKMHGSSIDEARTFFEKLAIARQKAEQGDNKMVDHFKALGISLAEVNDQSIRLEDLGSIIQKSVQGGDVQKLIADLRAVGGRGAGDMLASFKSPDFQKELEEAPVAMEASLNALKETGEGVKSLWASIWAFNVNVVGAAAGGFKIIGQSISAGMVATVEGVKKAWSVLGEDLPSKGNSPLESIEKGFKAVKEGAKEAYDTMKMFFEGKDLQEQRRLEAKEAIRKTAGAGDDDGLTEGQRTKVDDNKKKAADISRAAALAEVSAAQRLVDLTQEVADIKQRMAGTKDPIKASEIGIELAKKEAELGKDKTRFEAEIKRIKDKTSADAQRDAFEQLSTAGKIKSLEADIAKAKKETQWDYSPQDQLNKAKAEEEIAEKTRKIHELQRQEDKEDEAERKKDRFHAPVVSDRQRIGAYVDPQLSGMHNVAEESKRHLEAIHSGIDELVKSNRQTKY